jgi:hypothetical protein
VLQFDVVESGVLRFDVLDSGVLRFDVVEPGVLRFDVLESGVLRFIGQQANHSRLKYYNLKYTIPVLWCGSAARFSGLGLVWLQCVRGPMGTFKLLAQKLVFRSRQIDHRLGQRATKAMGELSGVISMVLKLY